MGKVDAIGFCEGLGVGMSELEPSGEPLTEPVESVAHVDPGAQVGQAEHVDSVSAAMSELDRLSELDLNDHPAVYQQIHTELQSALSAIDDA